MSKNRQKKRQVRDDGWVNAFSRSSGTKTTNHQLFRDPQLDPESALLMFEQDDFANTIVSAVVEDSMRGGFSWVDDGDDANAFDARALSEACKKWELHSKVTEADIWGRCTGGGFIMLGLRTGLPMEPLDDEAIGEGDLLFLDVYDRTDVIPYSYYSDSLSPKFGQVEKYTLQSISSAGAPTRVIHETRMIRFPGVLTSRRTRIVNGNYDNSALQCVFAIIQQADLNWKSIGALLADFAQGVFKIKDLVKILAQRESGVLEERMRLMDLYRSTERAIVLDADKEDFERKATPVAGAADLVDRTWQRLAAAARMPMTRLMRQSPAGMNATGESDTLMWYDEVGAHRSQVLAPRIERLGRIVARAEGVDASEDMCVSFPSLWQMSPTQEATYRKTVADTDKVYYDMGARLPEQIAIDRWGKGKYSAESTIDLEMYQSMLAAASATAEEEAGKPTPANPSPVIPTTAPNTQEQDEPPAMGDQETKG